MKIIRLNAFYRIFFAYLPAVDGIATMIYCHYAITNGEVPQKWISLTNLIVGTSFTSLLYGIPSSKLLGYCWIHRALIFYSFILAICMFVQRYFSFGEYLEMMRFTMLGIGIFLFYKYFTRKCWKISTKNIKV